MALQPAIRLEFSRSSVELFRYWSPRSQAYASGDQLLYYLKEGWTPDTIVEVETHWFGEARHILIYHFRLRKEGRELPMRVLGNPFAHGLVNDEHMALEQVPHRRQYRNVSLDAVTQ
jgi:hypothetical protein